MNDQTPAQKCADLLTAIANHLRHHPHLPTVNIDRGNKVQVWDAFNAGDDLGLKPGEKRSVSFEELHDALSST